MSEGGTLYAGLPVTGTRPLDESDEHYLEAREEKLRGKELRAVASLALFAAIMIAIVFIWNHEAWTVAFVGTYMLFLTLRKRVPQYLGRVWRWRSALRADRRAGTVMICEGPGRDMIAHFTAIDSTPRTALAAGPDDIVKIEILPESQTLLQLNGSRPDELCLVVASNPSAVPQHALMAANFVRPIDETGDVHMHQRLVSDAEREELERYVPRVPVLPILITALAAAGAVCSAVLIVYGQWVGLFPLALLSLIVGLRVPRLVKTFRFRRNVVRDLDYGYFLIVRLRQGEDLGEAHEFLPTSRLLWTIGGRVAPWRHLYAPR